MGRKINAVARPFAYGGAGLLAKKAYDGYLSISENGFTETLGKPFDWSMGGMLEGLHGYAESFADKVDEIPLLSDAAEALSGYVPSNGEDMAAAVLLSIGGCLLIREGAKFAHEPFRYIGRMKDGLKNFAERTKSAFSKEHGYNARPWEATKKFVAATWDKVKYAPIYVPMMFLAGKGPDLIEPVAESTGNAFPSMARALYADKIVETVSNSSSTLDRLIPSVHEVADFGGSTAEFLVKYALPAYIAVKAGNGLIRGYDWIIDEVKDVFRHRRNKGAVPATVRRASPPSN